MSTSTSTSTSSSYDKLPPVRVLPIPVPVEVDVDSLLKKKETPPIFYFDFKINQDIAPETDNLRIANLKEEGKKELKEYLQAQTKDMYYLFAYYRYGKKVIKMNLIFKINRNNKILELYSKNINNFKENEGWVFFQNNKVYHVNDYIDQLFTDKNGDPTNIKNIQLFKLIYDDIYDPDIELTTFSKTLGGRTKRRVKRQRKITRRIRITKSRKSKRSKRSKRF
jgi:hypothetical protein